MLVIICAQYCKKIAKWKVNWTKKKMSSIAEFYAKVYGMGIALQ